MRIVIAAVGRLKADAERTLTERYVDRAAKAGRAIGLDVTVREVSESRLARAEDRRAAEAVALAASIPAGTLCVALDERGESLASEAFARLLAGWRDGGAGGLTFLIGGPDGLDPALVATARKTIAFGAMTWPHQLVRALLAEQLYRAVTILLGHPYHRA